MTDDWKYPESREEFYAEVAKAKEVRPDDPLYQFAVRLQGRVTPAAIEEITALVNTEGVEQSDAIMMFTKTWAAIMFSVIGQYAKPGHERFLAGLLTKPFMDGLQAGVQSLVNHRLAKSAANQP